MTAFLSVIQLSRFLGVKPKTLYSWVSKKVIPHYRIEGLILFKKQEVEAWIETRHQNPEDPRNPKANEFEDEYSL
ncbi:MAG: helix-turn-helix domain-containing protein [Candidatus Nitrohelix vancouverensis]|uniref:Helix-turn-helix domain-containing protein n=1 Tax=Candidatus Nitrohelix vancouverensis TaxID=2705534 RepID=A0A7T0C1C5_9BACT|nr:MAG: helix-turn-helix domain-containing protein [Candidatus Nitrohelix vancouverensis]